MQQTTPSRARHVILMAVVFLAGALLGGSLTLIGLHLSRPMFPPMMERDPQTRAQHMAEKIVREYNLTEQEGQKIAQIMYDSGVKIDAVIKKSEPELKTAFDDVHRQIREVMPESKREGFDRDMEQRRKNLPFIGEGGRHLPPPPGMFGGGFGPPQGMRENNHRPRPQE